MAIRKPEEIMDDLCMGVWTDNDIRILKEWIEEVIDRCVEVAMAEDILNTSAAIKGEPYSAVWRHINKVKEELK